MVHKWYQDHFHSYWPFHHDLLGDVSRTQWWKTRRSESSPHNLQYTLIHADRHMTSHIELLKSSKKNEFNGHVFLYLNLWHKIDLWNSLLFLAKRGHRYLTWSGVRRMVVRPLNAWVRVFLSNFIRWTADRQISQVKEFRTTLQKQTENGPTRIRHNRGGNRFSVRLSISCSAYGNHHVNPLVKPSE